jgi:antitoxin VapB
MALNIKSEEAHRLARRLADLTNRSMTEAVTEALREAVARRAPAAQARRDLLDRISRHAAALPVLDERAPDDILGYDEHGLPS